MHCPNLLPNQTLDSLQAEFFFRSHLLDSSASSYFHHFRHIPSHPSVTKCFAKSPFEKLSKSKCIIFYLYNFGPLQWSESTVQTCLPQSWVCRRTECLNAVATLCVCSSEHLLNHIYGKRPLCPHAVRVFISSPVCTRQHRLWSPHCGCTCASALMRQRWQQHCGGWISVHLLCREMKPLISAPSFYSFISCSSPSLPG